LNLYEETKNLWDENKCYTNSDRWAKELNQARPSIIKAKKNFHQWNPLRVSTNLSRARKPIPTFSLRFHGQEVGELYYLSSVKLVVTKTIAKHNNDYFDINTPAGQYSWDSDYAKSFRRNFKSLNSPDRLFRAKSPEAFVHACIWEQMASSTKGGYYHCVPVTIGNVPFQCPVPLSASDGKPKNTPRSGNLDILARRGFPGSSHPAIWELKKPGECGNALQQVYIYGVQLALMLRAKEGLLWYRNMEFNGNIPKALTIDLILALEHGCEKRLAKQIAKFDSPLSIPELGLKINPFVSWYSVENATHVVKTSEPEPINMPML